MTAPGAGEVVRRVAATFDAVAEDYDQSGVPFFGPIAAGLVAALDPSPGERVLDIGCGRGAVTLLLAEAVLPTGRVTAVDVSEEMAARTRALLVTAGHSATVRVMDAGAPDLPTAAYDVVASSLVLFFLPDPRAALTRWVRLLAPGARIGLSTFGERGPAWAEIDALFDPWLPPGLRDPRIVDPDGPFATDAGMESLLVAAGARAVRTLVTRLPVPFADVQQWQAFSMSTGQRAIWAGVPAAERPGLVERARVLLEGARDAEGRVVLWQDVRYTLGSATG